MSAEIDETQQRCKMIATMITHWAFEGKHLRKLCEIAKVQGRPDLYDLYVAMQQEIASFKDAFARFKRASARKKVSSAEHEEVKVAAKRLLDATSAFVKTLADKELIAALVVAESQKAYFSYSSDRNEESQKLLKKDLSNLQFVTKGPAFVSKLVLDTLLNTRKDLEKAVANMELVLTQLDELIDWTAFEQLATCASEGCKEGKAVLSCHGKIRDAFDAIPKDVDELKAYLAAFPEDASKLNSDKKKSEIIKKVAKCCKLYASMFDAFLKYFLLTQDRDLLRCIVEKCNDPYIYDGTP
jgi:hypothetical protein